MPESTPSRTGRRLSAILAADVAGYSRLMHNDEEGTHARLASLLAEVVFPVIGEHGGRVVKHTGDGFLAEFPSAVEAVRAACQFQDMVRDIAGQDQGDWRLVFRVGINISDVIVEAHDIFGDGVNIAARLEGIAEAGGICISASAYEHVRGKMPLEVIDLGEQHLKNIARPVRVYAVTTDKKEQTSVSVSAIASSLPILSIVVLPFKNIDGDPEQEYFVDGVTESLTTDLSRISGSFVIARNTAFTFKNKVLDVREIGRALNVRYILEGSVQRAGIRLRVNVQLIDAETGNHLWAERFDKPIADFFDMQDEIVSRLANELDAELILAEAKRAERVLSPNALELCFRGIACIYKGPSHENYSAARSFFEKALAVDPECVDALLGIARIEAGWGSTFVDESRWNHFATAEPLLMKVLALAPGNAMAHAFLGLVQMATRRVEAGIAQCEHALLLDRNFANAWGMIAYGKQLLGHFEQSIVHVKEAERLSPRDIFAFRWLNNAGVSTLMHGDPAGAVSWLRRCVERNRNFSIGQFHLAAALSLAGEVAEAKAVADTALGLDPNFTIQKYRLGLASDNPAYLAGRNQIYHGMSIAGLPQV